MSTTDFEKSAAGFRQYLPNLNTPRFQIAREQNAYYLPKEWKAKAQSFKLMRDPGMLQTGDLVADRWNPDDQWHVCGAFRDNRVVPYEGICVAECSPQQQQLVLDIAHQFVLYPPTAARKLRLEQVERYFEDTFSAGSAAGATTTHSTFASNPRSF
ncbi:hypothetical protein B0A49_11938 [Cryomyces minteri]|uniref:Uncharacterized protein n=1 Tax=Cryomyces minteri TaxID=331657 RepID=A0A4U0W914_9PEZI|nr:hypothetical protein B0A49_11938 [Cryomyces minteri]